MVVMWRRKSSLLRIRMLALACSAYKFLWNTSYIEEIIAAA